MTKRIFIVLLLVGLLFGCSGDKEAVTDDEISRAQFIQISADNMPVVYFHLVVKSGSADDPAGKEGLAWFTANLMKRGSKLYTAQELEEKLELIGARLDVRVDRELIEFTGKTLLVNLDQYYEILKQVLLEPSFSADEAEILRAEQIASLNGIVRDDASLSQQALIAYLYANHPYAHPPQGMFESIEDLTVRDAREFYNTHFVRGNIVAGLAGMYSPEFAVLYESDMNLFRGGDAPITTMPEIKQPDGRRVIIIEKQGRDQSQIRLGRLVDYDRGDSAWYATLVANAYLGQHREMFGRLFRTVRAERGLSYGAYSYSVHFQQAGWSKMPRPLIPLKQQYFSAWTYPRTENTEFAIKMILHEMNKILSEGIPPDQLEVAKSFQINHHAFMIETVEQRLARSVEELYYGLPGFQDNFGSSIAAIDNEQVNSAVKNHWSTGDLLILILTGDAEAMKADLLDDVTVLDLPAGATETGLEEVNRVVKAIDPGITPEDIDIVNAEKLFHK